METLLVKMAATVLPWMALIAIFVLGVGACCRVIDGVCTLVLPQRSRSTSWH